MYAICMKDVRVCQRCPYDMVNPNFSWHWAALHKDMFGPVIFFLFKPYSCA